MTSGQTCFKAPEHSHPCQERSLCSLNPPPARAVGRTRGPACESPAPAPAGPREQGLPVLPPRRGATCYGDPGPSGSAPQKAGSLVPPATHVARSAWSLWETSLRSQTHTHTGSTRTACTHPHAPFSRQAPGGSSLPLPSSCATLNPRPQQPRPLHSRGASPSLAPLPPPVGTSRSCSASLAAEAASSEILRQRQDHAAPSPPRAVRLPLATGQSAARDAGSSPPTPDLTFTLSSVVPSPVSQSCPRLSTSTQRPCSPGGP